jgi:hypothetical protein
VVAGDVTVGVAGVTGDASDAGLGVVVDGVVAVVDGVALGVVVVDGVALGLKKLCSGVSELLAPGLVSAGRVHL